MVAIPDLVCSIHVYMTSNSLEEFSSSLQWCTICYLLRYNVFQLQGPLVVTDSKHRSKNIGD